MTFVLACLTFVSTSVVLAVLLALLAGGLSSSIAIVSLGLGATIGGWACWTYRGRSSLHAPRSLWEWLPLVTFGLFSARAFLWLIFTDRDSIKVLSPNNLGDISLHITYIRNLASGASFWPENPIVAGAKLTYPVGVDLLNALFVLTGVDLFRGLIASGIVGSLLTVQMLWRWGGAFTVAGFLFNGGLFGFLAFLHAAEPGWEWNDFQSEAAWKSIPLALFVTQRGLLYALPAGLALLCSWRSRYFTREHGKACLPRWAELLLYGTMPVFHLHTFLFLSLLLLGWLVVRPAARRPILIFLGQALIPATLLVLLVTGNLSGPSLLGWKPGWMQSNPEFLQYCKDQFGISSPWLTIPLFWLLNFGFLPIALLALTVAIARDRKQDWARAAVYPSIAVFLLCCLFRFAPWEWDNTKLMIWSYLVILPFVWSGLLQKQSLTIRILGCVILFGSGFASLFGGISNRYQGYEIARRSDLDLLETPLRTIPIVERFIAHPTYNHPLLLLGRPLVLGYTGHAWSHGYPWQESLRNVEAILKGDGEWRRKAKATGARYLFWGSLEKEAYPDSSQPWRKEAELVASGEWGEIYDLETLPPPIPEEVTPAEDQKQP